MKLKLFVGEWLIRNKLVAVMLLNDEFYLNRMKISSRYVEDVKVEDVLPAFKLVKLVEPCLRQ